MICKVDRQSITTGILSDVTNRLTKAKGLFTQVEGTPNHLKYDIGQQDKVQEEVNKINELYQDDLVGLSDDGTLTILPSEELILDYMPEVKLTEEQTTLLEEIRQHFGRDAVQTKPDGSVVVNQDKIRGTSPKGNRKPIKTPAQANTWAKKLLEQMGASYKKVTDIVVNGNKLNAEAVALPLRGLVLYTQDNSIQLSEEAMHIAVELLSQKDPTTYNQLMKDIENTQLYDEVVAQYKDDTLYQNKDGSINVTKMKKEAIGKALADKMVYNKETYFKKADTWWGKIKEFLSGLFQNTGKTVLDTYKAMDQIFSGAIGDVRTTLLQNPEYLLSIGVDQSNIQDVMQLAQSDISMQELNTALSSFLPTIVFQQKPHQAATDFITLAERVKEKEGVNLAEKKFLTKAFRGNVRIQNIADKILDRQNSTGGKARRRAFERMFDSEGYLKTDFMPNNIFEQNLFDRVASTNLTNKDSKRTVYKYDYSITNPKNGDSTTLDLIGIRPSGKVDMYTFLDVEGGTTNNETRVYRSFLDSQVETVRSISPTLQMGQRRVLPIDVKDKSKLRITEGLDREATDEGLFAIYAKDEVSFGKKRADAINTLFELIDDAAKTSTKDTATGQLKGEILTATAKALKYLQVTADTEPLVNQAFALSKKAENMVEEYNKIDRENPKITDYKDLGPFMDRMHLQIMAITDINNAVQALLKDEFISHESGGRLRAAKIALDKQGDILKSKATRLIEQYADLELGVKGINAEEKVQKFIKRNFRALSQQNPATLRALSEIMTNIRHQRDFKVDQKIDRIEELKRDFTEFMKKPGMSYKKALSLFTKGRKHELIDRYDNKFYTDLDKALKEGNLKWLEENIDTEAYNKDFEQRKQEAFDAYERTVYNRDDKINDRMKEEAKERFLKNNDITKIEAGTYNDRLKMFPKDKWETKEYLRLSLPENKAVKAIYDEMIATNKRLLESGIIQEYQAQTFMPFIRRTGVEGFKAGTLRGLENTLQEGLMRPDEDTLSNRDAKGELKTTIPFYFTEDFSRISREGERDHSIMSKDVFHMMYMLETQIANHEASSEAESKVRLLQLAEDSKKVLQTDRYGERRGDSSDVANVENSRLFDHFMKMYFYGHRSLDTDTDTKLGEYSSKFAKRINKIAGKQIITEEFDGMNFTFQKVAQAMKNYYTVRILGLNLPVSVSSLFNNSFHAFVNSGEFIGKKDVAAAHKTVYGGRFLNDASKKEFIIASWFLPRMDSGDTQKRARKLRMNTLDQYTAMEMVMANHRVMDFPVQMVLAISHVKNSMLDSEGNVININQFVKAKDEYSSRNDPNLSQAERTAIRKKMDAEIADLKATKSLAAIAKVDESQNVVIDGLEKGDNKIYKLRERIQQDSRNASGMGNEQDPRLYQGHFWLNQFMTFKSWMPRTIDSRLGEFRHVQGQDTYDWGRWQVTWNLFTQSKTQSIQNLIGVLKLDETGIRFLEEQYIKKKQEFEHENPGQEFTMDTDQFMEMYQRQIKSHMYGTMIHVSIAGVAMMILSQAKDADDERKGFWRYANRVMDKSWSELMFYYNPVEWAKLSEGNTLPFISVLTEIVKTTEHITKVGMGIPNGGTSLDKRDTWKAVRSVTEMIPGTKGLMPFGVLWLDDVTRDETGLTLESIVDPWGY